jgi:hypothetical protein
MGLAATVGIESPGTGSAEQPLKTCTGGAEQPSMMRTSGA